MKKGIVITAIIIGIVVVYSFMASLINNKESEAPTKPQEIIKEPERKIVVTIDNGLGEGDDRYILLNEEVIARVFVGDKIYDYKDCYVAIEKLDVGKMDILYKNLVVVDKYTGEKKEYELEKVEKNLGVFIESFDKDSGVVTIDTGITKYVFDINTRTMTEKI